MEGKVSLNGRLYSGGEQGGQYSSSSFTIPLDANRNIQYSVALAGLANPTPVALPVDDEGGKYITIYNPYINPLIISIAGGEILGSVLGSGGSTNSITLTYNQTIQFISAGNNTWAIQFLDTGKITYSGVINGLTGTSGTGTQSFPALYPTTTPPAVNLDVIGSDANHSARITGYIGSNGAWSGFTYDWSNGTPTYLSWIAIG